MITKAFAVFQEGEINVRTVSPTRRAAIVNFLVVERGILITQEHSDEDIELLWDEHAGEACEGKVDITACPL